MNDEYKASPHWQALNRIWKALPISDRESVRDDFRLLTEMVKEKNEPIAAVPVKTPVKPEYDFENRYLDGMSKAAKAYALNCLTQEHRDVYKEISDFIVLNKIRDMDNLWDRYMTAIPIAANHVIAVREIMCFCLERARIQNLV